MPSIAEKLRRFADEIEKACAELEEIQCDGLVGHHCMKMNMIRLALIVEARALENTKA